MVEFSSLYNVTLLLTNIIIHTIVPVYSPVAVDTGSYQYNQHSHRNENGIQTKVSHKGVKNRII